MARHRSGTPATTALDRAGVPFTRHGYDHDPASGLSFGEEAAAALGVPAAQVFKTLVAAVDGLSGQGLAVGVVPVDRNLDLKALAAALGHKRAAMAEQATAERATGYVVGGISPIGQRARLPLLVDVSAESLDRLYVSGGRRGLDVALTPEDLLRVTGGRFAAIAR